jgi:hypothetical protein
MLMSAVHVLWLFRLGRPRAGSDRELLSFVVPHGSALLEQQHFDEDGCPSFYLDHIVRLPGLIEKCDAGAVKAQRHKEVTSTDSLNSI